MSTIRVAVHAADPILRAGTVASLSAAHDVVVLSADPSTPAGGGTGAAFDVAVVVADSLNEHTSDALRSVQRSGGHRVVLVVESLDGRAVLAAVESGAGALIRRTEATSERLIHAVRRVAAGEGVLPADVLGRLLQRGQCTETANGRLTFGGLTERELAVLRLVADGYSTAEIAGQLTYSERTIKNALHDLAMRFQLRNRTHAVAFAVREGLI
ncbi:MAG TPA: response regulator transcription factor [Mycobacteriales bacterium]|jgi:DNA-binding NarL/FixJ family response regulator|nr:response regulator transcription factor [Mycobacteriales bacterium]